MTLGVYRDYANRSRTSRHTTTADREGPPCIDERRSLVRLMEQEGEDTADAHRLLGHLQHSLDDMIEFRDQVLREIEQTGG